MNINIVPNQKAQEEFIRDWTSKECLYLGGLGSGKTYIGARKLLLMHLHNRCTSCVMAPTHGDLYRIMVPALQSALEEWRLDHYIYPNGHGYKKYPHIQLHGADILLMSGEAVERLVGWEIGAAWCDESARLKTSDIPQQDVITQLRGRLRHRSAIVKQIFHTSTPESQDSFLYRDFFENITSERKVYIGRTALNTALPSDYIDSLKSSYSSRLQQAYLEGQWINASNNLIFYAFNKEIIASQIASGSKYIVSLDQNVSPGAGIVAQKRDKTFHVLDEIYIDDGANYDSYVREIIKKVPPQSTIELCGDASGNARNVSALETFYSSVIDALREHKYIVYDRTNKSNPSVYESREEVNRLIERKLLHIDPRCKHLVRDLDMASWKSKSVFETDKQAYDPHVAESLVYALWHYRANKPGYSLGTLRN